MNDSETPLDLNWLPAAIPCAAAVLRADGRLHPINHLWSGQPGEMLRAWAQAVGLDPEAVAALDNAANTVLSGEVSASELEFPVSGGGECAWWLLRLTGVGPGPRAAVLLIQDDITPQRRQRLDVEGREAQLRAILDTVPDGMVTIDERGTIRAFSTAAERQFGFTAAEVIGANVSILMPTPYREAHDAYLEHYLKTHEKRVIGVGRVVVARRKDGTTFPAELHVGEVTGSSEVSGPHFIGFIRDLTEKQSAEARLQELQTDYLHESRLHSLGEMAAQLAHELNQPLAAASNYLKAGLMVLNRGQPAGEAGMARVRQAFELAVQQTTRAGEIIHRLREFVSRGKTQMRSESIGRLIEEASALALVGAQQTGIDTHIQIASGLPHVHADKVQIQQVLLNLMRNGIEAMENSPTRQLVVGAERGDDMVHVSVTDTGEGISPEVAERLFQPFVTTKSTGMGIGLSTCRAIIEAHGGRLWWEKVAQGGTRFCFTLPLQHADVEQV